MRRFAVPAVLLALFFLFLVGCKRQQEMHKADSVPSGQPVSRSHYNARNNIPPPIAVSESASTTVQTPPPSTPASTPNQQPVAPPNTKDNPSQTVTPAPQTATVAPKPNPFTPEAQIVQTIPLPPEIEAEVAFMREPNYEWYRNQYGDSILDLAEDLRRDSLNKSLGRPNRVNEMSIVGERKPTIKEQLNWLRFPATAKNIAEKYDLKYGLVLKDCIIESYQVVGTRLNNSVNNFRANRVNNEDTDICLYLAGVRDIRESYRNCLAEKVTQRANEENRPTKFPESVSMRWEIAPGIVNGYYYFDARWKDGNVLVALNGKDEHIAFALPERSKLLLSLELDKTICITYWVNGVKKYKYSRDLGQTWKDN